MDLHGLILANLYRGDTGVLRRLKNTGDDCQKNSSKNRTNNPVLSLPEDPPYAFERLLFLGVLSEGRRVAPAIIRCRVGAPSVSFCQYWSNHKFQSLLDSVLQWNIQVRWIVKNA